MPKKAILANFRLVPPKVSLRKILHRTTALLLLAAGAGLPSEAASPLLNQAFADDTSRASSPGSEQWMVGVYQEGKRLFDLGDHPGALREWDKLSGSYDKNPSLKVIVDFMRKRIKEDPATIQHGREFESNRAEIEAKARAEAEATKDKVASSFLQKARKDVTKQVRESRKKGPSLETFRQQQKMLSWFAKGKEAYYAGDMKTAITAWDQAMTYLPENSPARPELEKLKKNAQALSKQPAASARAVVRSQPPIPEPTTIRPLEPVEAEVDPAFEEGAPVEPPQDMKEFLELADARFRSEAEEGRARSSRRAVSSTSRQDALNKSFRKSKLLYFQGQYEEAIDELNALARYFPSNSEEAQLIAGLRENYIASLQAKSEAQSALPAAPEKIESPAELRSFLEQANRKFDAMIAEADASKLVNERTRIQREEFVHRGLERARTCFDKERIEEALAELERVAPYIEDEQELLAIVGEIRAKNVEAGRILQASEGTEKSRRELDKVASRGIADFLKDARKQLDIQTKQIAERKKKTESGERDRGRRLAELFQNAKSHYEAGDLPRALDGLSEMTEHVEDGGEFARTIEDLRADYADSKRAADELKKLEAEKRADRLPIPGDLSKLLKDTQESIRSHTQQVRRARDEAAGQSSEKKKAFDEAYGIGREAYNSGRLDVALREWERLVPLVENGDQLARYLQDVRKDYDAAVEAERLSVDAEKNSPMSLPEDFYELLNQTAAQARSRAQAAAAQKKAAESQTGQRRGELERAYESGRTAYNAGDLEKAVSEWKALVPLITNGSALDQQLNSLQAAYREAAAAMKEAENAKKEPEENFRASRELDLMLRDALKQIELRGNEARAKRQELEKTTGAKRAAYERALADGKAAYQAGELEKAVDAWKKLVPLVEDGQEVDRELTQVHERFRAARADMASLEETRRKIGLRIPADVAKLVADVRAEADKRVREVSAEKLALEKSAAEKKSAYERALADGKAAYEAGDFQKASSAWEKLVPLVEDSEEFGRQLEALRTRMASARDASAALEESRRKLGLRMPSEISRFVAEAQAKAEKQASEAIAQKSALEKSVAQNKEIYERTLAAGREAYSSGKLEQAVAAWKELAGVVEGGEALAHQLKALEHDLQESRAARDAHDKLIAQKESFVAPAEVLAATADISKKLQADIAQSRTLAAAATARSVERRNRVNAAIADGLAFYKKGLTSEAISRWESILPDIADSDLLQKAILEIRKNEQEIAAIQKTALQAEVDAKKPIAVPADLTQALDIALSSAKARLAEAKDRQTRANDEAVRKQTLVTESIQNGKLALARGDVDTAVEEWTKVLPLLENGQALQPKLQDLKASHLQMTEAQKIAASAEEKSQKRLASLPELDTFVTEAALKYKNETHTAKLQKEKADAAWAEKKALVEYTVNKAREIFERGDIPGSTLEAMKLQSLVEDPTALQASLASIQTAYDESLKAQTEAVEAVRRRDTTLFKQPVELSLLLTDADAKVKELTILANRQKMEAEQALKDKEAMVQQAFERGKALYWEGKLEDALREWDSIAPLLENSSHVKAVTGRYEETLHIQRQAREITARKDAKFQTPAELQRLLNDAEKILASQSNFAVAQQRSAENQLTDRQEFINRTFQKGKALYEQGMIAEAIEEWEDLAPVLENGSKVKEFIDRVKTNYKDSLNAKKGAEEAQARSLVQPQAPADLTKLLEEANEGIQAETERARRARQESEETLREKQAMIDEIFKKGKGLYQAGRLEEAVDVWKTLLPLVDDSTSVRQLIQQAEESRRRLLAERFESQNNIHTVATPGAMQFALEETNSALKDQIARQQAERVAADLKGVVRPVPQAVVRTSAKALPLQEGGASTPLPFKLDEIEQMMLEYNVVTPEELQKRRETLRAASASASSSETHAA